MKKAYRTVVSLLYAINIFSAIHLPLFSGTEITVMMMHRKKDHNVFYQKKIKVKKK